MVPRIHKRGSSFQGACLYVLHDPGKNSSDRVLWKHTVNLGEIDPEDAWRAMHATWLDRTRLKREAGVDLRGRDNKTPVLHVTLSWAQDEKPDNKHLRETALSVMKVLKLEDHQAVIAAHSDKEHLHVHLIINTVHPTTGRTAPLKHSKLELSKWAEAYEREHGIKIEQRIRNNEERRREAEKHAGRDKSTYDQELGTRQPQRERPAHRSHKPVYTREDILLRLKRLHTELSHRQMVERDATHARHRDDWRALLANTKGIARNAVAHVEDRYRPAWRELYRAQERENAHLDRIRGNVFERAVFVFLNSERLAGSKPLTPRQKLALILSPKKLQQAVDRVHTRERRQLGAVEKAETKKLLDPIWATYDRKYETMRRAQSEEFVAQRLQQNAYRKQAVDYRRARNQIKLERQYAEPVRHAPGAPAHETDAGYIERVREEIVAHRERNVPKSDPFVVLPVQPPVSLYPEPAPQQPDVSAAFDSAADPAPPGSFSRAEQIKRDMAEWKRRNPGRDFGREM